MKRVHEGRHLRFSGSDARILEFQNQSYSQLDLVMSSYIETSRSKSLQFNCPLLAVACFVPTPPRGQTESVRKLTTFALSSQVHPDDINVLSVIQYAVDAVGVEHVIIAGHTHCGGAAACRAAACKDLTSPAPDTPLGKWLEPLTSIAGSMTVSEDEDAVTKLVEENVKAQVRNVINTKTLQGAWASGKNVQVHGWVYQLENGRVRDLGVTWGKEQMALLQLGL